MRASSYDDVQIPIPLSHASTGKKAATPSLRTSMNQMNTASGNAERTNYERILHDLLIQITSLSMQGRDVPTSHNRNEKKNHFDRRAIEVIDEELTKYQIQLNQIQGPMASHRSILL